MSNKTQLQTNNTALDALITRVNAAKTVVASLPLVDSSPDLENPEISVIYTGVEVPTDDFGSDGDIYILRGSSE